MPALAINWAVVIPVTLVALALNWVAIRKRHERLLDWASAGVSAVLILFGSCAIWYVMLTSLLG